MSKADLLPDIGVTRSSEDPRLVDGYEDYRKMMLSIGMPAIRIILTELIKQAPVSDAKKRKITNLVNSIEHIDMTGCLTGDFIKPDGVKQHCYYKIVHALDDYSVVRELDKVDSWISDAYKTENHKVFGCVIVNARMVYNSLNTYPVGKKILTKLRKWHNLTAEKLETLDVDETTSTLHPCGYSNIKLGVSVEFE